VSILANQVRAGYGLWSVFVWRGERRSAADERQMQNGPASVFVCPAGWQGSAAIRVQHISREVQPMSPLNETEGFEPGDDLLDKAACHRADVAGSLSVTEK
jgi:hypothetical protein